MKLERGFKFFCFGLAGFILLLMYWDLVAGQTAIRDYLGHLGLFLVCIEMGVLMSYEQLSAKVTLKSFFSKQSLRLSPIGMFAHRLGQVGCVLLMMNILFGFFK